MSFLPDNTYIFPQYHYSPNDKYQMAFSNLGELRQDKKFEPERLTYYFNNSKPLETENISGMSLDLKRFTELRNEPDVIVLDTRNQDDYMKGHVPNSLFIPYGGATTAGGERIFPLWCNWVLPKDKRVILVSNMDKHEHISAIAKLQLAGFDKIVGYLEGGQETWKNENAEGSDVFYMPGELNSEGVLNQDNKESHVLDVRKPVEWEGDGVFTNAKL